jgi:hypothetical protein
MRGKIVTRLFQRALVPLMIGAAAALALGYPALAGCPATQVTQGIQGYPQPHPDSTLPGSPGMPPISITSTTPGISPPLSRKQKDVLLKQSFKKTREDVAKLSKLVQALQKQVDRSNANVLSLSIIKQATNIEKLARKIKNESRMY